MEFTSVPALLDHIITANNLKNDAALAKALKVAPPVISKVRHGKLPLGAAMIIYLHEFSGLSVKEIKTAIKN